MSAPIPTFPTAVGINYWSVRQSIEGLSGPEIIDALVARGLDGFEPDAATRFSPTLDAGELAEVRAHAQARSFYLEGNLPSINPLDPAPELLRDGDGDARRGLERHLRALREVLTGTNAVRAILALPWDRGQAGRAWSASWPPVLEATAELLRGLLPLLRDLDLRIAIENHGDATTAQLVELANRVDPERCGICIDTANLALTLEGPLEGVERAAPYAFVAHIKDGVVMPGNRGDLILHARLMGEGVFPIEAMLAILQRAGAPVPVLTIEDHDGLFPIATSDPDFVAGLRADGPTEESVVAELVAESVRLVESGQAPTIEALEAIPWTEQEVRRVTDSAAFVRAAAARLAAGG